MQINQAQNLQQEDTVNLEETERATAAVTLQEEFKKNDCLKKIDDK